MCWNFEPEERPSFSQLVEILGSLEAGSEDLVSTIYKYTCLYINMYVSMYVCMYVCVCMHA